MDPLAPEIPRCPRCGETLKTTATHCWICGQAVAVSPGQARILPVTTARPTPRRVRFSLSSLMLVIALIAVWLGVAREEPGLGLFLVILTTPALLRTVFTANRRRFENRPMSVWEKLYAFVGSLGLVLVIGLSSTIAFGTMCFVGFWGGAFVGSRTLKPANPNSYEWLGYGMIVGIGLGVIMALVVGIRIGRLIWKRWE